MNRKELEAKSIAAVEALFAGESSGHDAAHSLRVYRTAMQIAASEPCDEETVMLAALLHDADDVKLFHTANAKGRVMYDPAIPPEMNMDEARYRAHRGTTVNHFHEKLFLLREKLNTQTARRIAVRREAFMREFLDEFYAEWEGSR